MKKSKEVNKKTTTREESRRVRFQNNPDVNYVLVDPLLEEERELVWFTVSLKLNYYG